ncbi:MAG: flagellar protein [candidate division Zixibacteria bacterium]|nr:flagellar protein [candidate division Zixibacteria bacterium]
MKITDFNRPVNLLEIASRGRNATPAKTDKTGDTFKDTFSRELAKTNNVEFSKHARARLFSRGIEISDDKLNRLSNAIDRAAAKGSKETLILDDDAAYVASVDNRTIITALSRDNLREGVVTSIDSAIIL